MSSKVTQNQKIFNILPCESKTLEKGTKTLELTKITNVTKEAIQEYVLRYHLSIPYTESLSPPVRFYRIKTIEEGTVHWTVLKMILLFFIFVPICSFSIVAIIKITQSHWNKYANLTIFHRIRTLLCSLRFTVSVFLLVLPLFLFYQYLKYIVTTHLKVSYAADLLQRNEESGSKEVISQAAIINYNAPLLYKLSSGYIDVRDLVKRLFSKDLSKENPSLILDPILTQKELSADESNALVQYICDFFAISKVDFMDCWQWEMSEDLKKSYINKMHNELYKNEIEHFLTSFRLRLMELIQRIDQKKPLKDMSLEDGSILDQLRKHEVMKVWEQVYSQISTNFQKEINGLASTAVKKFLAKYKANKDDCFIEDFLEAKEELYIDNDKTTDFLDTIFKISTDDGSAVVEFDHPVVQDILLKAVLNKLKDELKKDDVLIGNFENKVVKEATLFLRESISEDIHDSFNNLERNAVENACFFKRHVVEDFSKIKHVMRIDTFLQLIPSALRKDLEEYFFPEETQVSEPRTF